MRRPVRIVLWSVVALTLAFVVGLALFPLLFKDRIVERLRTELDARLDAQVDFADVDLTLLSTFPTLTVEIEELQVRGEGVFEGIDLLRASSIGAGIDLLALVFDRRIEIRSVLADEPRVHVVVTGDGLANYDIVTPTPDAEESPAESDDALAFDIEDYEIRDATLIYEEPGFDLVAVDLQHRGSLRVSGASQALRSTTKVKELSLRLGGVRYLKNARTEIDLEAIVDGAAERLSIERLRVALNRLSLEASGWLAWAGDATEVDVRFASAEGLPLKALVSAIPNAYAADFDGLETGGSFSIRGAVKGKIDDEGTGFPAFDAAARVRDGRVKYPDLPLAITDIELDAKVDHRGGSLDRLAVAIEKYGFAAGKSRAAGRLDLRKPLSGPDVDLVLDGRFDLDELAKAYPLPDVEGLRGNVEADVDLSSKGNQVSKLEGTISATDVVVRQAHSPELRVLEARVELAPKQTTVKTLRVETGRSDASLRGVVSPLTVLLSDGEPITASLWVSSKRLVVEDFLGDEPDGGTEQGAASGPFVLPDGLDARLDLDVQELRYDELILRNFRGSGRLKNRKLTLNGVRADALGGSMKLDGTLTTHPSRAPAFDMTYVVDRVSFAEAFEALPSMRAYAPIARFLDGRFSTDLRAAGTLEEDFSPKLDSIDAGGLVAALQSKLSSDFRPLQELSRALPAIPKPLGIEGFRTRFKIEDGAVEVKPFTATAGSLPITLSGRHGLDQEMQYELGTKVPIDGLSSKLAAEVRRLGIDVEKVKDVGVKANLTGSIQSPRVSVDVDTGALRGAVADALSAELEEQRARALAEAQAQADRLVKEAEAQAAKIRAEAKRAAERARQEGYARAEQLEREAAGNPLKEIAGREAAKRLRNETDKRADQAIAEADRRAEQVVAEARKRADQALKEAAVRSDQASEELETKTTDRIR